MMYVCLRFVFFFFKQKTAYEMRISDWSSDVCSSDLTDGLEVTSRNLEPGFEHGAMIAQDGRNVLPVENQNYKYVSWEALAGELGLEMRSAETATAWPPAGDNIASCRCRTTLCGAPNPDYTGDDVIETPTPPGHHNEQT